MSNERGYTLAEMLVVCAIVGLVMASLLGLVLSGQQAFWFGTTQVDAQQTARVAIAMLDARDAPAGEMPVVLAARRASELGLANRVEYPEPGPNRRRRNRDRVCHVEPTSRPHSGSLAPGGRVSLSMR